jgi:hypothetical protein
MVATRDGNGMGSGRNVNLALHTSRQRFSSATSSNIHANPSHIKHTHLMCLLRVFLSG